MNSDGKGGKILNNNIPNDPECTFKPYVSEISSKMAENKERYGTVDYIL